MTTGRANRRRRSTLVLVDRLDIVEDGDLVLVAIEGSHFLWKMVRRVVGVLAEVGRGGLAPGDACGVPRRLVGGARAPDGAAVRAVPGARVPTAATRGMRRFAPSPLWRRSVDYLSSGTQPGPNFAPSARRTTRS